MNFNPDNDNVQYDQSTQLLRNDESHVYDDGHVQSEEPGVIFYVCIKI